MSEQPVYIYGLKDPRTDGIRYVGKTVDLSSRMSGHMTPVQLNRHKGNWITGLRRDGLIPDMVVLETTDWDHWEEREKHWIKYGRDNGWPLTNISDGGNTNIGLPGDSFADLLSMYANDENKTAIGKMSEEDQFALAWEAAKIAFPGIMDAIGGRWKYASRHHAAVCAFINGQLNIVNGI